MKIESFDEEAAYQRIKSKIKEWDFGLAEGAKWYTGKKTCTSKEYAARQKNSRTLSKMMSQDFE